jgi:hypothetical protein
MDVEGDGLPRLGARAACGPNRQKHLVPDAVYVDDDRAIHLPMLDRPA